MAAEAASVCCSIHSRRFTPPTAASSRPFPRSRDVFSSTKAKVRFSRISTTAGGQRGADKEGKKMFITKAEEPARLIRNIRSIRHMPSAVAESTSTELLGDILDSEVAQESVKLVTEVKATTKPRLVLKFIWMEKNIGLALNQIIPGHGTVPLSPYFFWPRKDAWEELKATLESKPWISQKKMIILLNQATDIINLWQQSGGNLT